MAGEVKIGLKSKLYIDAAGVGEGTWQEAGKVGDVGVNQTRNEVEIKERDQEEVGIVVAHKVRELTIQLTRRPGNAVYEAFRTAYENGTYIGVAAMESGIDVVGTKGYQADMHVTQFNDNQAIESGVNDVTLKRAADSPTPPALVTVVED